MTTISAPRAVVQILRQEGVSHVFGIPGGQTLHLTDALLEVPEIRFVATRHENGAATAADAFGRLTGRPAVCLATTGPGATNLLTGVGGAFRDSSPMLVFTFNNKLKDIHRDDAQDADHIAIFRPLTKWAFQIVDPRQIATVLPEAFARATTGTPGPVLIDFARDVLTEGSLDPSLLKVRRPVAQRIAPDPAAVAGAAAWLAAAERPVLWAGGGVKSARAAGELAALAERLQAPVVTTHNGIGAIATTHPLCYGPRSRFGTRLADSVLAEADLVLAVGNSLNAVSTTRWGMALPPRLIQVDVNPEMIGRQYPEALGVWGDAGAAMAALAEALPAALPGAEQRRGGWLQTLAARRREWLQKVFDPALAQQVPLHPQWVMKLAGDALPADALVAVDAGNPGVWSYLLPAATPYSYMKPVGYGNMGFALGATVGARAAHPDRPILCVIGDGSLGMSLGELETLVRCGVKATVLVLNDQAYGNIKQEQMHYFGPRYIGVDFTDVDYAAVARAMGAQGERVRTGEELAAALQRAAAAPGPYLIDALIDPEPNIWDKPV